MSRMKRATGADTGWLDKEWGLGYRPRRSSSVEEQRQIIQHLDSLTPGEVNRIHATSKKNAQRSSMGAPDSDRPYGEQKAAFRRRNRWEAPD